METGRRLITSSSFAVGWLHLDGAVHLEKRDENKGGKGEKEEKGNPRLELNESNKEGRVKCGGGHNINVLGL